MLFRSDGLILICPWLDVRMAHPDQPMIEARDSILTLRGARDAAALYAKGMNLSDPRISPILGNWDGLPPIQMFAGCDDILLTDARALKSLLPSTELIEGQRLMHDWPIFFFPEARAAQRQMAGFAARSCAARTAPSMA